jgi:histidine triad (HIT) family protein
MSSIFSKIVNGEIPAHKVAEDDNFLAFFDINPLKKGHTLVIPKKEVDYLFDLDTETYRGLMDFTKRVAKAIEPNVECKRLAVLVLGLEVPHAHIHLIPMDKESDVHFSNPRLDMTDEEFKALAEKVNRDFR